MIKTIDITNITDEMIEVAAGSAQLRAMAGVTEHDALIRGSILAALIVAPAVEPAQRCNCCGYLVTDSEHKGCLRAAKQEPAQAVPVAWKHDCAALLTNNVELWIDACPHCGKPRSAPPAIDDETRKLVLELCELTLINAGPCGMVTAAMKQRAVQIREKLEVTNATPKP